jgi:hypothetical protein
MKKRVTLSEFRVIIKRMIESELDNEIEQELE